MDFLSHLKIISVFITMFIFTGIIQAQISPGELARAHKNLEGIANCTRCHELGSGPDAKKCLECHQEIRERLSAGKGYHHLVVNKESTACFKCHSEHNGNDFKLVFWPDGMDKFNHELTGYILIDKHADLDCRKCHNSDNITKTPMRSDGPVDPNKTFLGLKSSCITCHDDIHHDQLSDDCAFCHSTAGWKPAVHFDHDKARFKLTGRHISVDCSKCHQPVFPESGLSFTRYNGLSFQTCSNCHIDVHEARLGQDCAKCHTTLGWQTVNGTLFNHDLTRFPLQGRHQAVACRKCHNTGEQRRRIKSDKCKDCHLDKHNGQFAHREKRGDCEECHDVSGFSPSFFSLIQHQETSFPLENAHRAIPCADCHNKTDSGTGNGKANFELSHQKCSDCHNNAHGREFKDIVMEQSCTVCHKTTAWQEISFDHRLTHFILTGRHEELACRKCHKAAIDTSAGAARMQSSSKQCQTCHTDVHQNQFTKKSCKDCHGTSSWFSLTFNHNRDSQFKLDGAHTDVPCSSCHPVTMIAENKVTRFKPLDMQCISCHDNQ